MIGKYIKLNFQQKITLILILILLIGIGIYYLGSKNIDNLFADMNESMKIHSINRKPVITAWKNAHNWIALLVGIPIAVPVAISVPIRLYFNAQYQKFLKQQLFIVAQMNYKESEDKLTNEERNEILNYLNNLRKSILLWDNFVKKIKKIWKRIVP